MHPDILNTRSAPESANYAGDPMTLQQHRRREQLSAALEPCGIFGGLLGIIFGWDWAIAVALGALAVDCFVASHAWIAVAFRSAAFIGLLILGNQVTLIAAASKLTNVALPLLLYSSLIHVLSTWGIADELLEKKIASGEFQQFAKRSDQH